MTDALLQPAPRRLFGRGSATREVTPLLPETRTARWFGQPATIRRVPLQHAADYVPAFSRRPFGPNLYLDMIVRQTKLPTDTEIPVGTVSKQYALIQHATVIEWLSEGMAKAGLATAGIETELTLSTYGERMRLWVAVPQATVDPGDGHGVTLAFLCQNSVDRSCALELSLSWRRLICANGLWRGVQDRLRRVHQEGRFSPDDVQAFIGERMALAAAARDELRVLLDQPVSKSVLTAWIDGHLTKAWGPQAATRVAHITRSGWDGRVMPGRREIPPSRRDIAPTVQVPGACAPVGNVYHVAQALSWVAGSRPCLEDQQPRLDQIPALIAPLQG